MFRTLFCIVNITLLVSCKGTGREFIMEPTGIRFRRISSQPFMACKPGTFHRMLVANPAITEFKGDTYLFFRGQSEEGHDQIGVAVYEGRFADEWK